MSQVIFGGRPQCTTSRYWPRADARRVRAPSLFLYRLERRLRVVGGLEKIVSQLPKLGYQPVI